MNHAEAVILCRAVAAYCPQQHVDEFTPNSWHDLLDDIRLTDAKQAAIEIARVQPFVAPAEIRAKVREIRNARIAAAPPLDPPPGLGDDEVGYRRWLAESRRRIADGEPVAAQGALSARDVRVIKATFREVPPA